MGRKCCVRGCKSNYDVSTAKNVNLKIKNDRGKENLRNVKMFGLPIASDERKIWIKSIPNLTEEIVSNLKTNPAVCVRHWPPNFSGSKSSANGSMRPELPPTKELSQHEKVIKEQINSMTPPQIGKKSL